MQLLLLYRDCEIFRLCQNSEKSSQLISQKRSRTTSDILSGISDVLLRTLAPNCFGLYLICYYRWFLYRSTSQGVAAQHGGFHSAPNLQHHLSTFYQTIHWLLLCEYIHPYDILYISRGRMHVQRPQRFPLSIPCAAVKCEKAKRRLASWSDRICKASHSRQNPIKTSELAAGWG